MGKLKIHQKKISKDHNDSIWYNGLIAEYGKYKLYVIGDVEIYDRDGLVHDGWKERNNGIKGGLKNDKDLKKVGSDYNDKYYWSLINWFELIYDGDQGEGIVEYDYDEGIKTLKRVGEYGTDSW